MVMTSCQPARIVLESFAEVARALAHEHRLELLEHLAQGERSVEALAGLTDLSPRDVTASASTTR